MRLFKRKMLRQAQGDKPSLNDKVAKGIAGFIVKVQTKFADVMQKYFSGMSTRRMKIFLFLFCLVGGGLSIYYIVNAVFNHDKFNSFKIDHVDVPKHYDKTGDELTHPPIFVDEETHRQLQTYIRYMDSLKTSGAKLYDSIMVARPGLTDSVLMMEQIYNSQK